MKAGLDQEGGGNGCVSLMLPQLVKNNTVSKDAVATAFRRLFRIRIRLGMLDPPSMVSYNGIDKAVAASDEHLDVALRAARESICLYKNDPVKAAAAAVVGVKAAAVLPLVPGVGKPWKLLLAGAQGNSSAALLGNYSGEYVYIIQFPFST